MSTPPVVIVGAGPVGVTAATLLAQYGIEALILERWDDVYPRPRAVHLDGEIRRIMERLGVGPAFDGISRAALGLRLLDPTGRVLAQFDREPYGSRNGHPEANLFDQPDLEAVLRANLTRYPLATLRGGVEVTGIAEENDCVRVDFVDTTTGAGDSVRARFLLGCDGANSMVRAAIGSRMLDMRFDQRWLVVDIATSVDLGQWEGVHQICDPARAATYMRIGNTRHRWEFRLHPGETAADYDSVAALRPLLAAWLAGVAESEIDLVRVAEYTFRARVADRWRRGRVFLLGDAAHLTPPFIGQGMGAGLRDAANLTWKLAAVLGGALPERILDTYESERKPHARAMIRLAKLTGIMMTAGGRFGDRLRGLFAPRLHLVPGLAHMITSGESPPLRRGALVHAPRPRRGLAGRLVPNPTLANGRRLDDLIAGRYAILTTVEPAPRDSSVVEARGGTVVVAARDTELYRWLRCGGATAALVRPDGTVQRGAHDLSTLCGALPSFGRVSAGEAQ
ncbi:bifunctional 3-(3-hydroxy-phenyl)propionate/3-hydroxycinnamic acid hydroxylase [Nocardia otitidiscaviarum]|uniref:bifunctional 3-(3-hydroxy-phenyl)propionate/3-hydroxycinnamic acid hydroxylase MhpA n=1 Tax=Nocardia otitidiscaviarum TaxID=1823 RepID=UPI0004A6EFA4|nr:bifunctional 3-(3-hydroxy-phenyl)propionate/3-hydroxycinnamic acid hydroxylase [Nocardia otitidiscaviarum]MBF6136965.1 bifunctional 3-(3-hydroxy-phenyl)propionate/3-hydroxycinnamic acid hydroxylase [Nocardia otitidiscaviarum]MBF6485165.1 bifunctional 3-(3-hydroxy-phenyl)propionate/3-hydroxycinnamic acid hydroxylase [Nocardia otitidiscaviarum]